MARIEQILEKNGKKLMIGQFLSESVKEKDENGEYKEDFVTIKKLSYEIKTKIKFLSMKSFSGKTQRELLKNIKKSGKSFKDIQNINTENQDQVADFLMEIDYENLETEKMADATLGVGKYIIEYGLDPKRHSFKNNKNKQIELNYDTLNAIGNEDLIKYIIENIKKYSEGIILGE